MTPNGAKPTTHQRDLANLPPALLPLIERDQWCVWRWTQLPNGKWQKPPFMAVQPERHASTTDPTTWTDYPTALAAVQAGHADGISYVLTADDPFGAIDLDHCRDQLGSIAAWAQNYMQAAHATYQEITPSGEGIRIWGVANGDPLNRKFTLGNLEKSLSLPIADSLGVNVNESERERNGIIRGQFCGVRQAGPIFRGAH
jgi:primase-polymerase (primpol)-like protein